MTRILIILLGTALYCCRQGAPSEDETIPPAPTFEHAIQLTSDRDDSWPTWSYKGNKIAFERRGYIYTIDVASGAVLFITQGSTPAFSPRSDQIVLVRDAELYKIPPLQKMTIGARASDMTGISWSSDEDRIAFFRPSNDGLSRDLWVYQISTNEYHQLAGSMGWCEYPCWSPNNEQVLFLSKNEGICMVNYQTHVLSYLLMDGMCNTPVWWPVRNRILYTRGGSLYSILPEGGESKKLIEEKFYPKSISCERLGDRIAFSYEGIWIMDLSRIE